MTPVDPVLAAAIASAADHVPTWMLLGEEDRPAALLPELKALMGPSYDRMEVEIVGGRELHGHRTPDGQQIVIDRVVSWAARTLQARDERKLDPSGANTPA